MATHYWAPGWATALDEYLRQRTTAYTWISHGLFDDGQPSVVRGYRDGHEFISMSAPGRRGLLRFISDVHRTVRWSRVNGPVDLFIAGDNLLAMAGLWLRWRGHTRSVVMYSIDFVPRRFANALLNAGYQIVDRLAVFGSDVVWNGSAGIQEARGRQRPNQGIGPQLVVPMGAHVARIRRKTVKRDGRLLVYLGHLLEKQGVQVIIEALPAIIRIAPEARLLVIGDGPYAGELRRLAEQLKVARHVEFAGFMDDHEQIEGLLLGCSIGLAPYVPGPDNYSEFTDLPGKIINYLACGLAVITTPVPRRAALLEEAGAGRVVPCTVEAMADAITTYLASPKDLREASRRATEMARAYDWDEIFSRAFYETASITDGAAAGTGNAVG